MDNSKVFLKYDSEFKGIQNSVNCFSNYISRNFWLEKNAKLTFNEGRIAQKHSIYDLDFVTNIRKLGHGEAYKCLCVSEEDGMQHKQMKEKVKIKNATCMCVWCKLRNEFTKHNINNKSLTGLSLLCKTNFDILNWTIADIKQIDVKTRKLHSWNRPHHPKRGGCWSTVYVQIRRKKKDTRIVLQNHKKKKNICKNTWIRKNGWWWTW